MILGKGHHFETFCSEVKECVFPKVAECWAHDGFEGLCYCINRGSHWEMVNWEGEEIPEPMEPYKKKECTSSLDIK